jgi:hypothetical protein
VGFSLQCVHTRVIKYPGKLLPENRNTNGFKRAGKSGKTPGFIFPARKSLVSDNPSWEPGKGLGLFYSVFRHRSMHYCYQKSNQSGAPVPFLMRD